MGPKVSGVTREVVDGTSGNQTIDVVVSVRVLSILPQQKKMSSSEQNGQYVNPDCNHDER